MLGFPPIFEVFTGLPTGLTKIIFGTANQPNINKWPGAKFGKISLNCLDLWHFSPQSSADTVFADPKGPNLEKNQTRLKFSISLEMFNLDLQNSPQKIAFWWVARLKISISLENFKILKFFKIRAFCGPCFRGSYRGEDLRGLGACLKARKPWTAHSELRGWQGRGGWRDRCQEGPEQAQKPYDIYIYIYMLWGYYLVQVWGFLEVIIWSKLGFWKLLSGPSLCF